MMDLLGFSPTWIGDIIELRGFPLEWFPFFLVVISFSRPFRGIVRGGGTMGGKTAASLSRTILASYVC